MTASGHPPGRRTRRPPLATALVIVALAVVSAPSAGAAQGDDAPGDDAPGAAQPMAGLGIRLFDVPLDLADDPRAQNYIIDHVRPGTTISRRLIVSNGGADPFTASVYPVEATITDNRFVPAADRARNELASWTAVDRPRIDLDRVDAESVTVTIDVPTDAPQREHHAVVFAEQPPASTGGGVGIAARVGIRIYLSVGSGAAPTTAFDIGSITARRTAAGEAVVTTTVTNTGGRAIDLSGDIALLDGPGGADAGPFGFSSGTTIASGDTGAVEARLDPEIDNGPWLARIRLRSGLVERVAEAEIRLPPAGDAPLAFDAAPVSTTGGRPAAADDRRPIEPLAAAALVLGALLVAVRLRRPTPTASSVEPMTNPSVANRRRAVTETPPAGTERSTSTVGAAAGAERLLSSRECVDTIARRLPFAFSVTTHATVARNLGIRPAAGEPDRSLDETYCHYDRPARRYRYTEQWVDRVVAELATADGYRRATGREPIRRGDQSSRPVS